MSTFKKILIILPIILLLLVTVLVLLYWQTNVMTGISKRILNNALSEVAEVEYSQISGDLFNNVYLTDLRIMLSDSTEFHVNNLKVRHSLNSTISGEYHFEVILIDSLFIDIPSRPEVETESEYKQESIQDKLNRLASSVPLKNVIQSLPIFSVDDLQIKYGRICIGNEEQVYDQINLEMNADHEEGKLEINIKKLSGMDITRSLKMELFRAQILGNEKRININQLELRTVNSVIEGYAEITLDDSIWLVLGFEDTYITLDDIESISGADFGDSGYVSFDWDLVGHPNRFSTQLFIKGKLNDYQIDSLAIDGDYYGGEITLRDGFLHKDTMLVKIRGKLSEGNNYLDLKFTHLNLMDLYPELFPTDLNGSVYAKTRYLNDPLNTGFADLRIHQSSLDTLYLDTLRFAARAKDHNIQILDPSFLKMGKQSKFVVEGTLSKDKIVDLKFSTEENALNTLTLALNLPNVKGTFDGNFFLSGNVYDPNLEGYLWVPHLEKDSFILDSMILQLDLKKLGSKRQGHGLVIVSNWQLDSLNITQTLANIVFDSNRVVMDTLLFANRENYVTSKGYLEFRLDTIDIVFSLFRMNYQSTWLENEEEFFIRLTPDEYIIENAVFKSSEDGLIEIRGYWDRPADDMRFGLYMENINFTPVKQFMSNQFDLSGTINADFELANPATNPELDMEFHGKDLVFNQIPLGNVHCVFQYEDDNLYIDEFKMTNGNSILDVDGDITIQFGGDNINILRESMAEIQILWKNIRIEDYITPLNLTRPVKGEVTGRLSLKGTITEPEGKLSLFAGKITYDKFISDSLFLISHFNKDSLIIDEISLDLNKTELHGSGWQLLNLDLSNIDSVITGLPFELNLVSKDDEITFIGNMLDQVERIEGPYEASFTLGGTIDKPALIGGYFRMENGRLILSRIRNPITGLSIDASVEDSMLIIHSMSAYSEKEKDFWQKTFGFLSKFFRLIQGETRAEGELYADGYILLDDIMRPTIDISINAYKLYLDYFIENTNFMVTTNNLHIHGTDSLIISGDISIDEGEYIVDLSNMRKNIYLSKEEVNEKRPTTWNLDVTIPGNFIISSSKLDLLNNFKFEIMGDIRSIKEAYAPSMDLTGHLEIISGKYGSWGQTFGIQTGQIDFVDPKVINPEVNILAEKKTGSYIIQLSLKGNLDKLEQNIQVMDENGTYLTNLTDQERLSLISLGTTSMGDIAGAGGNVISTSVETIMERGAEELTGLDKVELSSSKGGNLLDLQSMKLNQGLSDASVSLGKYLTSDLYIEYTGMFGSNAVPAPTVSWQPGNQVGVEYRINMNWSVDSHYLRTLRGNNIYKVSLAWKLSF